MASASGNIPKIIAIDVMMIGRKRVRPALRSASCRFAPSPRFRIVKSTRRIPFLTTRPMSMIIPIMLMMFRFPLVTSNASATPMKLSGSDIRIDSGCRNDPKSDAMMR